MKNGIGTHFNRRFLPSFTDRVCTLSGAKEAVTHAKDLLNKLCNNQNASSGVETVSCILIPPAGASGYPPYQEIMVPGSKVGLVIGKGGETIKMLQEKTGAKMVIIQDGPGQELVVSNPVMNGIECEFHE